MIWGNFKETYIKNKFLKIIFYNFWLKFLSIIFATLLFLIVKSEQVHEYSYTTQIKIITNNKIMVVGSMERSVYITVKLPNSLFYKQPEASEIVGRLDLTSSKSGKLRYRLAQENFPLLDKKYKLIIQEPWIEVELDEILIKKIDVNIVFEGKVKKGYVLEKYIQKPEKVEIIGPKKEVNNIQFLTTSIINIDNANIGSSLRADVILPENSSTKLIQQYEKGIEIQYFIEHERAYKLFNEISIITNTTKQIVIQPATIDVELQGKEELLNKLNSDNIHAFIDIKNLTPGWYNRSVRLQIPPDTTLVRVTPATVMVHIIK